MSYTIPVRLTSVLAEADRIAPRRRRSSDGTLGDSAHRAEHSDHNPEDDPGWPVDFIVHAVDVSESKPGTPYWQPYFDVFDVHALQRQIAAEYLAASLTERNHRWPWLFFGGYMVGFDGHKDVIFNPSVSLTWRQNGRTPVAEHNQHGHFSIGHNAASENDTQPIFGPEEEDMPLNANDLKAIDAIVQRRVAEAIGGGSMDPPNAHATVVDVVKHYAPKP